jgi:hypothetical protein
MCLESTIREVPVADQTKLPTAFAISDSFYFTLQDSEKELIQKGEVHTFVDLFEKQAPSQLSVGGTTRALAKLKDPVVSVATGDALVDAITSKYFPQGMLACKSDSTEIGAVQLRGRLGLEIAKEGGEMTNAYAAAPCVAILLPGGGTKIYAMADPKTFDPKTDKNAVVEHDRESLERGLLTSPSGSWVKLQAWEGVYLPAGTFYKDVSRGPNTTTRSRRPRTRIPLRACSAWAI